MTFQVGVSMNEGALLASDRLMVNTNGPRVAFQAPKIIVYEELGFAHCSAGDDFCSTLTKMVRDELESKSTDFADGEMMDVRTALENLVKRARLEEAGYAEKVNAFRFRTPVVECAGGTTMLVFRGKRAVSLWKIDTLRPYPSPILIGPVQCVMSGDTNGAGVFFGRHYFRSKSFNLNAMIRLAAHTVLMAKGDNVEGLEIGVFTKNRFGLLSDEDLNTLIALSKEIDSDILRRLQAGG